jgi:general secretion pathway protein K
MVALVGEFTYGTTVEAAQAANARDEVRAHYMALSSVNLSRLLIKIQQRFVEPVMGQAQQMLQAAMKPAAGTTGASGGSSDSSSASPTTPDRSWDSSAVRRRRSRASAA